MSRPLSGFTLGDTEYPFLQKPYRGQAQLDSHLSLGTLFDSLFDTSILESWIPTYNIPSAHIVAPIPPDLTKREWFTSFFFVLHYIFKQTLPAREMLGRWELHITLRPGMYLCSVRNRHRPQCRSIMKD
ncbi:hypothetical protein FOXYSP1_01216 [Fusarium oxysporum f. sp. phaseoli]